MKRMTVKNKDGVTVLSAFSRIDEAVDKLAAYEDAEEAGLLVRLPCKIGTPCFCVGYHEVYSSVFCYNNIPYFGKTIFLTREEAETALKGVMESNE